MKMQFVPASHGQNTLGTDVPRIIRHDGAKNRVGRVPGTRTGAADLDYEGNVYTEKRVMWETLSPGRGSREEDSNREHISHISTAFFTCKYLGWIENQLVIFS